MFPLDKDLHGGRQSGKCKSEPETSRDCVHNPGTRCVLLIKQTRVQAGVGRTGLRVFCVWISGLQSAAGLQISMGADRSWYPRPLATTPSRVRLLRLPARPWEMEAYLLSGPRGRHRTWPAVFRPLRSRAGCAFCDHQDRWTRAPNRARQGGRARGSENWGQPESAEHALRYRGG